MKRSLLFILVASTLVVAAPPEPKPALDVMAKARGFTLDTSLMGGGLVLRPGDHIDVVAVMQDTDGKRLISVTLLQNVIVLFNASLAPGEPRQLSLLLIPEEAEILAFAKESGHLTATLRNVADIEVIDVAGLTTLSTMLTGDRTLFPKRPKK